MEGKDKEIKPDRLLKKSLGLLAWTLAVLTILGSAVLLVLYSLNYQTRKTQQFFIAFFFGLAKKLFVNDALFLTIYSSIHALIKSSPSEIYYQRKKTITPQMARIEHLTTKLNSLKRMYYFHSFDERKHELIIREAERTREHYKEVVRDLIMFLFYIATLVLIVLATKDDMAYYTKESVMDFITEPTIYNPETHQYWDPYPIGADELFRWLNTSFINNINDGTKYNGDKFKDPAWVTFGYGKVLGVARLRQQRDNHTDFISNPKSGWKRQIAGTRYAKDFWRIAEPWTYRSAKETDSRGLFGKLFYHPGGGYVAQLGRTKNNTQSILNFLYQNSWHDANTKVIFVEFCLYNVDTNLFIIVNIVIERTPFQFHVSAVHVEPVKLLVVIQNFELPLLFAFYFYVIMIFVFSYALAVVIRNSKFKKFFSRAWNIFDAFIILLSVLMLLFYFVRSDQVEKLLVKLEEVKNNEFVSFEPVLTFEYAVNYLSGFLVCFSIIRLWKILHFSPKFRIFTITLKRAAVELFATVCCMAVLFIAFGLAVCIINGNHSETLKSPFTSITQSIAYGLGFGKRSHAQELFKGGKLLGPILGFVSYVFLVGVCAIFMTNMFVAVACIYLSEVQKDQKVVRQYSFSFWEFILIEYGIHHIMWKDKKKKGTCSKVDYPFYGD